MPTAYEVEAAYQAWKVKVDYANNLQSQITQAVMDKDALQIKLDALGTAHAAAQAEADAAFSVLEDVITR